MGLALTARESFKTCFLGLKAKSQTAPQAGTGPHSKFHDPLPKASNLSIPERQIKKPQPMLWFLVALLFF